MLFSSIEAFAEALTFAEKQNLDRGAVAYHAVNDF